MGDLVFIDVAQKRRDDKLQQLWHDYMEARARAEKSANIVDGIAAGKAWAAFVAAFVPVSA